MALRITSATERALDRVARGEAIGKSADAEGIARSTLFRALARGRDSVGTAAARGPRTLIVGAGALGRELANWIRRRDGWRGSEGAATAIGFLDDGLSLTATQVLERGIVGAIDPGRVDFGDVVYLAINDPKGREAIAARLAGIVLQSYADPSTILNGVAMGAGCLLLPNCLLSDQAVLGDHVVLNTFASVGHDCSVGDFSTLSSYVGLCGRVRVGKRVFLGIGALVLPDVTIGDDAVIGAGAVVLKDVAAGAKVFGNPARAIA